MWMSPHSAPRPSLRSLDLASTSKSSLPLTPPLTPASTQADSRSSRSNSFDIAPPPHQWSSPSKPLYSTDISTVLPSPTSPTRPRLQPDSDPTRFLFVSGVPKDATSNRLKQAFLSCGDLKGIFVRFQQDHGAIVLAFYDSRHTQRAARQINSRPFFDGARLQAHFISPDELRDLIGQSNFVNANDGSLRITTSPAGLGGELDPPALQNVLASFGELRAFGPVDPQAYHAEFFDARDATSALNALDGRVILRERLHLSLYTPSPAPAPNDTDTIPPSPSAERNSIPFPTSPRPTRRLSVDSIPLGLPHSHQQQHQQQQQQQTHTRRTSNIYHFDSVGKAPAVLHTPPRPRSISVNSEAAGLGLVTADVAEYEYPPAPPAVEPFFTPVLVPPSTPALPPALPPVLSPRRHHAVDMPPERNRIDIAKIERGDDTRTTVMIKNIPNKMSDRHLIEFINDVCPRKIDFLYLRMDFTNGCNVGYAFVNFIHVEDLLYFAKAKLGTKWNLFSSEKILGMSYANYQGKEALIDKFRSSSIMDQRESWRPKLFFSSGAKKGLPEEFPAPTHVRRKERAAAAAAGGVGGGVGTGVGGGLGGAGGDVRVSGGTGTLFHHHHHHQHHHQEHHHHQQQSMRG